MNCNPRIVTNNSDAMFLQLGINCTGNPTKWWSEDQPSYVSGSTDPNYGSCLGYTDVPSAVLCAGSYPTTSRLCRFGLGGIEWNRMGVVKVEKERCDQPSTSAKTFGTSLSSGAILLKEQFVFGQVVAPGDVGVLTHFWITYASKVDDGVLVRYYVDGETEASIAFTPSMACGVGSYDTNAPWGTKWFGKVQSENGGVNLMG